MRREPFARCPHCHKYILPPGMVIVVAAKDVEKFCSTRGECTRVECAGCGFYVNPKYHSQWECEFAQRAYEQRNEPLNASEVLAEAEAILKGKA